MDIFAGKFKAFIIAEGDELNNRKKCSFRAQLDIIGVCSQNSCSGRRVHISGQWQTYNHRANTTYHFQKSVARVRSSAKEGILRELLFLED